MKYKVETTFKITDVRHFNTKKEVDEFRSAFYEDPAAELNLSDGKFDFKVTKLEDRKPKIKKPAKKTTAKKPTKKVK